MELAGNVHTRLKDLPPKPRHHVVARLAAKHAPGPRYLDLGCGAGHIPVLFKKLRPDAEISIADAYPACLDLTERKLGNITARYLVSEAEFDVRSVISDKFDAITLSHVLEHLLNPVQGVRDCMSLLKPGGVLVIAVPNPIRTSVLLGALFQRHYVNRGHVVCWDGSHFKNFLERILRLHVIEYDSDTVGLLSGPLGRQLAKLFPWWAFSLIAVVRKEPV